MPPKQPPLPSSSDMVLAMRFTESGSCAHWPEGAHLPQAAVALESFVKTLNSSWLDAVPPPSRTDENATTFTERGSFAHPDECNLQVCALARGAPSGVFVDVQHRRAQNDLADASYESLDQCPVLDPTIEIVRYGKATRPQCQVKE